MFQFDCDIFYAENHFAITLHQRIKKCLFLWYDSLVIAGDQSPNEFIEMHVLSSLIPRND